MSLAPVLDSTELLPARADTDSWTTVVGEVAALAAKIADTEFVPRGLRGSVPATAAAILYGREVGLPPMTALSQIHVVEGRPALAAEAMRALVLAAGHEIAFDETTTAICRIRGRRLRSQTWTTVEWSIDLARRANLLRRGSAWETYPREMLIARATTALCRMIFPDVIHGFRAVEELDDTDAPASSSPPVRSPRRTVSRRRPTSAHPDEGEPGSVDPPPNAPPAVRTPSLPGESEEGGDGDIPATVPPSPPPTAATTGHPVPPAGPDYPGPDPEVPRHAGQPRPEAEEGDRVNRVTLKLVFGQLRRLGLDDATQGRDDRLLFLSRLAGRDDLTSANDLTQDEGTQIATVLSTFRNREALEDFLSIAAAERIARVEETVAHVDHKIAEEDTRAADPYRRPTEADFQGEL